MKKTIILLLVLANTAIAGCSSRSEQDNGSPLQMKTQDINKTIYVVSGIGWASFDVMNLKKVVDNSNNQEVIKQLFETKAIFPLKVGMKVQIIEEYSGIVKIKPVDNDAIAWAFKNILTKEM